MSQEYARKAHIAQRYRRARSTSRSTAPVPRLADPVTERNRPLPGDPKAVKPPASTRLTVLVRLHGGSRDRQRDLGGEQCRVPGKPARDTGFDLGGPDWMAGGQGFTCHPRWPMGAAKGVLALRSGPVMVADGRAGEVAAISLALGPVPPPATPKIENQDLGRLQWQC